MDDSAINAILGNRAMQTTEDRLLRQQLPAVMVHKDYSIENIERMLPAPARFRGTMTTSHLDSFAQYVTGDSKGDASACFIDPESMSASAILDFGHEAEPEHRDHKAVLRLAKTPAYEAICKIDGNRLSQREIAEWLEDWLPYITFPSHDHDGDEDAADIPHKKAITAIRNITIEQASKAQHETQSLSERRTAMQSIEANSTAGDLPQVVRFECVPYEGLSYFSFDLRLSITTGERLGLTLRIRNHDAIKHTIAECFQDVVTDALAESKDMRIYIGTFAG